MPRKLVKDRDYHFIYKTTCNVTGRYYIGMHSTDNLDDGYLGSGRRLRYSINKYGIENHIREILEFCSSREELKSREEEIVNLSEIQKDNCLNLMEGGSGGAQSPEIQRKWIEAGKNAFIIKIENEKSFANKWRKNISNGLTKAWKDEEYKSNQIKRLKTLFKDCNHSEETKKKIGLANSKSQKGKRNSQYGTCWITKENINKKVNKTEIDIWLAKGWSKGRKINRPLV